MTLSGLSLVFPCLNEAANIEMVIEDALREAPRAAGLFEIIVVDDGSTDETALLVQRHVDHREPVRLIRHDHRRGYGAALISGFNAAKFPWVFFSDSDRQFDLQELSRLTPHADHSDLVAGYRERRADPWHRRLNATLFGLALKGMFGLNRPDINCAFKLIRLDLLKQMNLESPGALINAEIFLKARKRGARVASVGVTHKPRVAGKPTGAQGNVIWKAMRDFYDLRRFR